MAIFLFDVVISLGDFMLERASRQFFGGLPTGEYVLHILLAMLFGALVTSVLYSVGHCAFMPTRITYEPAGVPIWFRAGMVGMAVLVLISGVGDARAVIRLTMEARHERKATG